MAERTYRTIEGDMVDWIAWVHYGHSAQSTEAILERNRHIGLSDYPLVLPAGLLIVLPDLPKPVAPATIRLWD